MLLALPAAGHAQSALGLQETYAGLRGNPAGADLMDWDFAGANAQNTHSSFTERQLSPATVSHLKLKWTFTTTGNMSATPTVEGDSVYAVDAGGSLFRIDANTGTAIWTHKISDYSGNPASFSRTSPAIAGDAIVIGDQGGATVFAINKTDGRLIWKQTLDTTVGALITGSPVVVGDRVYVGVSSSQESLKLGPNFTGPTFRGQVAALDARDGHVIWTHRTVPPGYTGGAVWGSTFAVDLRRNHLYVGVGNNYSVPPDALQCIQAAIAITAQRACVSRQDEYDSVLALDLITGEPKWIRRMDAPDIWTLACNGVAGGAPCPNPPGADFDFGGAGVALFTTVINGRPRDLVGAGQKKGVYWAFDPDTGAIVWATQVGPGGTLGGIEYGTATDGQRVYTGIGNSTHAETTLVPSGQKTNGGFWSALDAATGKILWQTLTVGTDPKLPTAPALAPGSVSVANGVMYGEDSSGEFVALNAATGAVLWHFASGGSAVGGPAIVNGSLYWGTGYTIVGGISNNKLYAFDLGQ